MSAFSRCNNLTTIYSYAVVPPVSDNAFMGASTSQIDLYVPAGSVEAYQQAAGWKTLKSIQVMPEQQILPEEIIASPSSFTDYIGASFTIDVTVLPEDADDKSVTFSSSLPDAVSVDDKGFVKLLDEGVAEITITSVANPSVTATVSVNSEKDLRVYPTSVELPESGILLPIGSKFNIGAKVLPEDSFDKRLRYVSSNPDAVEVDLLGNVMLKELGVCFVYITSMLDSSIGTTLSVTVVKDIIQVDGINYKVNQPTTSAYVVSNQPKSSGHVVIPKEIKVPFNFTSPFYKVTEISEGAFENCNEMTSVSLPESIDSIGKRAFAGTGLYVIDIPQRVKTISTETFADCDNLVSVSLPYQLETIQPKAFFGSENIRYIFCVTNISATKLVPPTLETYEGDTTGYGEVFSPEIWPDCRLVIPSSMFSNFEKQAGWKNFRDWFYWHDNDVLPTELNLSASDLTGSVNDVVSIIPSVGPSNATCPGYILIGTQSDIFSVTTSGTADSPSFDFTLLKEGEATVAVYCGFLRKEVNIKVSGYNGVSTVVGEDEAPRWFNMQGVEIAAPADGQIVIEVRGDKSVKKVYRR